MSFKPRQDDGELPSYHDVIGSASSTSDNQPIITAQQQIQGALFDLATHITYVRNSKLQELQTQADALLNLILPQINDFIFEFGQSSLFRGALIFIPYGTVKEGAVPCDDDLRSPDEFRQVKTVVDAKGDQIDLSKWPEAVARLVRYLRPRAEYVSKQAKEPQLQTTEPPAKKSSWWKKSAPEKATAVNPSSPSLDDKKNDYFPIVTTDFEAEEMAFRSQSLLGLYETQSVWGLICKIQINAE